MYEALADFHEAHRLDPQYSPSIKNMKILCQQIGIDNLIDAALQKKHECNYKLCQIFLECVLIADESNKRVKRELIKQKNYFTFLLPDFKFSQIKGAINPSKRGIALGYETERELQNMKEVKFLLKRRDSFGGKIEIKNVRIE